MVKTQCKDIQPLSELPKGSQGGFKAAVVFIWPLPVLAKGKSLHAASSKKGLNRYFFNARVSISFTGKMYITLDIAFRRSPFSLN